MVCRTYYSRSYYTGIKVNNGKLSECMIQSSHRFGILLRRQICLNPVWPGGLRSPASLELSLLPIGRAALTLTAHPPNCIETNLATPRRTKPAAWLNQTKCDGITRESQSSSFIIMILLYGLLNDYREHV